MPTYPVIIPPYSVIFSALSLNAPATLNLSMPIQLFGNTLIALQFVTGWTPATISFQGSTDGINFAPVYDSTGTEITITVPSYTQYMIVTLDNALGTIGKLKWVRLQSGTNGSPVGQDEGTLICPIFGAL